MARIPDDVIKRAERMYRKGKSLAEIARKVGVSDRTVREWRKRYGWEGEPHNGAPYGNRNAVGCKGNPNPKPPPDRTKHGAYSKVYLDALMDGEEELLSSIPDDEESMLMEQIGVYYIRERRILNAIKRYMGGKEVVVSEVSRLETKRNFQSPEEKERYDEMMRARAESGELPGEPYTMQTRTVNKDSVVMRLESELTSVQRSKTHAIEALSKLRADRRRLEESSGGSEAVDDWIASVMQGYGRPGKDGQ